MPNFSDVINNFGCGNDLAIQRSITGIPLGETLLVSWFLVKRELSDADADAIITKRVTPVDSTDGWVTNDGTGNVPGVVLFELAEADTAKLSQPHFFEIRVETSDARQYTSNRGVIRGQSSVMNSVT